MDSTTGQAEYKIKFRFTTFDTRKSMATGREGSVNIWSTVPQDEIPWDEVKQLCVNEVLRLKPKWNILLLDVLSITPIRKRQITNNGK